MPETRKYLPAAQETPNTNILIIHVIPINQNHDLSRMSPQTISLRFPLPNPQSFGPTPNEGVSYHFKPAADLAEGRLIVHICIGGCRTGEGPTEEN